MAVLLFVRDTHLHHAPTKTALPGGTFGYLMFVVVMMMSSRRERGSERVRKIVGDDIYMCVGKAKVCVVCVDWRKLCVCARKNKTIIRERQCSLVQVGTVWKVRSWVSFWIAPPVLASTLRAEIKGRALGSCA